MTSKESLAVYKPDACVSEEQVNGRDGQRFHDGRAVIEIADCEGFVDKGCRGISSDVLDTSSVFRIFFFMFQDRRY